MAREKEHVSTIDPKILLRLRTMHRNIDRKPAYIGEMAYKAYNLDCVRFLAKVPDESVDMVFTDEPFGAAHTKISVKNRVSPVMDTDFDWDVDMPLSLITPWVYEAYRILKPGGAMVNCGLTEWTTAYKDICVDAGFYWKASILQIIANPRPQVRKSNLRSSYYLMWWASKGTPKTFNFLEQQEMRNWQGETICPACGASVPMIFSNQYTWPEWVFSSREIPAIWADISPLAGDEGGGDHPTKKPLWLSYKYIEIFTNTGDVVLDPFCGGGTFPFCAAAMGRVPLANDKSRKYAKHTESRLQNIPIPFIST